MSYQALYRAWRPDTFSEMCGQDAITRTLKHQVMTGHIGHAYLFCGSRGTGKTSCAKILAKAVNCLQPRDGNPCNCCSACQSIESGVATDVIEMDAASNNGVDDIRSIREEVNFLPTKAKYRVYIIDEVHMLSTSAFNALLKTLEEPPTHVIFILATTDPQKIPATILNRVQGNGCPFCSGKRPVPGKTDFATLHPELAEEWDWKIYSDDECYFEAGEDGNFNNNFSILCWHKQELVV